MRLLGLAADKNEVQVDPEKVVMIESIPRSIASTKLRAFWA